MKQIYMSKNQLLCCLCLICALLLAACQPVSPPDAGSTEQAASESVAASLSDDSIAGQLRLKDVTELQLWAFDDGQGDWSAMGDPIADETTIAEVVNVLNQPPAFIPRSRCMADYRLVFVLSDGSEVELGYMCGDEAQIIRGDQPFWEGQDAEAPAAFIEMLEGILAQR